MNRFRLSNKRFTRSGLILAAAGYAAAELGLGLAVGFFDGLRAEPLLFLALRPWLLLLAAALVSRCPWRQRLLFSILALALATASKAMLLGALGAAHIWPWALRGLAAGALLALLLDFAFHCARGFFGEKGTVVMALPLLAIFLYPGSLRGYEAIAIGGSPTPPAGGPALMLMTDLPIIWGEQGPFDPESRPAAAYRMLQREFAVTPLDTLDAATLGRARLMLLAQPRALAPAELVALDAWVRQGGRLLILTDPALQWPSELPLGDLRRAPAVGLLAPLLTHWGIRIESPAQTTLVRADLDTTGQPRRLALAAPGFITVANSDCRLRELWLARCRIGSGEALILADADLLHDDLWVGAGPDGEARHHRLSDNAVVVADLLDSLAGLDRAAARGHVDWLPQRLNPVGAVLAALLPLLMSLVCAAVLRRRP